MKHFSSLLYAVLCAAAPALAQETFHEIWIADRLTVGLGLGVSSLTDNHRRADKESGFTYVGFVNTLENEHKTFLAPEISWWAARNLRLHLTVDHVEGHTRNYNNHRSDGTVRLRGPLFEAQCVFPMLGDTLFPKFGVGAAWEMAKFRPETWWKLGWYGEEEYRDNATPGKTKGGYSREIRVDDTLAWTLSAGASWRPARRFQLDATLRHVWVEPKCEYGERRVASGYTRHFGGKFWLDHLTAVVSASYVF